ncbi:MAG: restriction endonuclease subunit S [Pseudomonadota bacterium]
MTATNTIAPRAFAVWWKDFDYWQVRALWLALTNKCRWPTVRLGDIATVRSEVVPDDEIHDGKVSMLDRISFDEGRVFFGKRTTTRMVQFRARPGDIVVSKINARKRAIGIVQDGADVGVTIHFRALIPDAVKVDAEFLWAALRSTYCSQQFEIETGGIGKGEISEERLLAIAVPLPPMATQKAIVARWRKAQDDIAAARGRVIQQEAKLPQIVYQELGTPPPLTEKPTAKCLAMWWRDLERWSFNYLSRISQGLLGFSKSKFPIEPLGNHLFETMNGYCIKPVAGPTPHKMLKLNALNPAGLDLTASKFVKVSDHIAERFSLHKDDILICRSNAYEYVAKCALVREDQPAYLFPDIIIRACVKPSVFPEFITEVIQTPLGRSYFQVNSRRAVGGMWKISADDILNFPLPLPPLTVQKQIIERVAAGREEIVREREAADRLAHDINAEVEALILGTKKVSEL